MSLKSQKYLIFAEFSKMLPKKSFSQIASFALTTRYFLSKVGGYLNFSQANANIWVYILKISPKSDRIQIFSDLGKFCPKINTFRKIQHFL